MENVLRNGTKIIYEEGKLFKGLIVGNVIVETSEVRKTKKLYCEVKIDKESQDGFVGTFIEIDLLKDITMSDDNYYLVELYKEVI